MSNVNFRVAQLKEANKRLKSEVELLKVENQELVEARFADKIIVEPLRRENKHLEKKLEESKRGWIISCLFSISSIAVIVAHDFLK